MWILDNNINYWLSFCFSELVNLKIFLILDGFWIFYVVSPKVACQRGEQHMELDHILTRICCVRLLTLVKLKT